MERSGKCICQGNVQLLDTRRINRLDSRQKEVDMKKLLISLLFLPMVVHAQAGFIARANGDTAGQLSNHTICGGTGCVVDNRISTSTSTGFTSPASVDFLHFSGKDFTTSPDNGVVIL